MRVVTWNCKGGFSRKHASIAALDADILVLPECGRLDALENVLGARPVQSFEWVGDNPRKGLGVVSYGDYTLSIHPTYDPELRWILPLAVAGPADFTLLAVWTVPDPTDGVYAHALFNSLQRYSALLKAPRVVVAGDFNQSVLFDRPRGKRNFAEWIDQAQAAGLRSAYHFQRGCGHGCEPEMTFFLHHDQKKGDHIDFIFASESLLQSEVAVQVGDYTMWSKQSDHMPMACTFGIRTR